MTAWALAADAVHTDLPDGSVVVLSLGSKQYHTLNESAALLWRALAERAREPAELTALLVAEYEVEPALARRDVERLLAAWADEGLARRP